MTHTDVAHTSDVSLACVIACDSINVNAQSDYISFDFLPKFFRSVVHTMTCKKLVRLLIMMERFCDTLLDRHHTS